MGRSKQGCRMWNVGGLTRRRRALRGSGRGYDWSHHAVRRHVGAIWLTPRPCLLLVWMPLLLLWLLSHLLQALNEVWSQQSHWRHLLHLLMRPLVAWLFSIRRKRGSLPQQLKRAEAHQTGQDVGVKLLLPLVLTNRGRRPGVLMSQGGSSSGLLTPHRKGRRMTGSSSAFSASALVLETPPGLREVTTPPDWFSATIG